MCICVLYATYHTHTPFTNTETKRPKLQKKRWVSVCYVYNLYIYTHIHTHKLIPFGKVINECLERVTTIDAKVEKKIWVGVEYSSIYSLILNGGKEWENEQEQEHRTVKNQNRNETTKKKYVQQNRTEQNIKCMVRGWYIIVFCGNFFIPAGCVYSTHTYIHSTAIKWLCFLRIW